MLSAMPEGVHELLDGFRRNAPALLMEAVDCSDTTITDFVPENRLNFEFVLLLEELPSRMTPSGLLHRAAERLFFCAEKRVFFPGIATI